MMQGRQPFILVPIHPDLIPAQSIHIPKPSPCQLFCRSVNAYNFTLTLIRRLFSRTTTQTSSMSIATNTALRTVVQCFESFYKQQVLHQLCWPPAGRKWYLQTMTLSLCIEHNERSSKNGIYSTINSSVQTVKGLIVFSESCQAVIGHHV